MNPEPKHILIVEDDPGLALLFGEHLRRLGCSCDTVDSAQACSAWLGRSIPDLMVLDYSLPDMLAPALVASLRTSGRLPPFVVVTGHGDERVAVELMKLGARDYLVKDHQVFDRLPVVVLRALQDVEKERRLATTEVALLASEARLRRAEIVGGFGHWEMDIEAGVIRGSAGAARIYGLDGELWPIAVPRGCALPVFRPVLEAQHQQLVAGEAPYDVEFEIRRYSDDRLVAVHSTATYDPFTRTVFGIIQDITERRQVEESLRQKTALLEAQLDSSLDGILVVDGEGNKVLQNRRTVELWKVPAAIAEHPDDRAQVRHVMQITKAPEQFAAKVAHLYAHPQETSRDEVELTDGTVLDRYSAPVSGQGGRYYGRIWVFRDITERKRAEEALRESLHEKEALLKEVHHRVKNNLQVITSLLRLQAGQSAIPATREVLRDMQNRIRSMALLHETLYRSGNLARVDLADYLQNVCTQLLRSTTHFETGRVRLQFDLAAEAVVATQAVPCGLLVNELVSNSLKHAFPEGRAGVVSVSLRREIDGTKLRLEVADDGVGLPADFAVGKLQSLGLHLVSDLSRQLDGMLAIGPGPGCQFVVTFTPALPALSES